MGAPDGTAPDAWSGHGFAPRSEAPSPRPSPKGRGAGVGHATWGVMLRMRDASFHVEPARGWLFRWNSGRGRAGPPVPRGTRIRVFGAFSCRSHPTSSGVTPSRVSCSTWNTACALGRARPPSDEVPENSGGQLRNGVPRGTWGRQPRRCRTLGMGTVSRPSPRRRFNPRVVAPSPRPSPRGRGEGVGHFARVVVPGRGMPRCSTWNTACPLGRERLRGHATRRSPTVRIQAPGA